MEKNKKETFNYIKKLEDKIVDLSLQLKRNQNELKETQSSNYEHIRKIVHDLKNPIGIISSFSEMLQESTIGISSDKQKKYIDVIKNSSDFSIKLLNSIGDLNGLKSPNFKLNKKKTNYNKLIYSVINRFNKELANKNITIESDLPENTIFVNIDEDEIIKVVEIILNNAIRYSSNNSSIYIKIQEKEDTVETSFSDNGIGIPENNLITIFDEFSALNTYSEDGEKCIGLGLTIAQKIIKFHNGQISAHSNFGSGSIFKFVIPNK